MANYWYAVTYAYGRNTINRGSRPNLLARFRERTERDRYVSTSTVDNINAAGYTEAVDSRHPYVRRTRTDPAGLWQPIEDCRGEYTNISD